MTPASSTSDTLPGARIEFALVALIVCTGIGLRLLGLERGLWYDEAWVLDSVRAPSLNAMFYYTDWAQTTPPGVLLAFRALRGIAGHAPEPMRWVPWLCGVLMLVLLGALTRRLLPGMFALPVLLIMALSPEIIWYATEIKQYAFDLLAMTALLYGAWWYGAQPDRTRAIAWFVLFGVCAVFSYTVVFALPAMALALLLHPADRSLARRVADTWLLATLAFALCATLYLVFARGNSTMPTMYAYWRDGFFASAGISPAYYLRRLVAAQASFLPFAIKSPAQAAALLALCGAGVLAVLRRWRGSRGQALAAMLVVPVPTVLLANLLGFYPLAEFRLFYFLCANILVMAGLGLQWCLQAASQVLLPAPWRARACALALLATLLACGWGVTHKRVATVHGIEHWVSRLEVGEAVRYLHLQDALARPLFVHVSVRQLFKEYRREYPVNSPVLYGEHGWPCCVPGKPWTLPEADRQDVDLDTAAALRFLDGRTGNLLIRKNAAKGIESEHVMFQKALAAQGCTRVSVQDFTGVMVLTVECPSPLPRGDGPSR